MTLISLGPFKLRGEGVRFPIKFNESLFDDFDLLRKNK